MGGRRKNHQSRKRVKKKKKRQMDNVKENSKLLPWWIEAPTRMAVKLEPLFEHVHVHGGRGVTSAIVTHYYTQTVFHYSSPFLPFLCTDSER